MSKKNDGNIEFSIDSKNGVKWGPRGVGGPPADDDRGCYDPTGTPFLLLMLNKSMLNSMSPLSMLSLCRC